MITTTEAQLQQACVMYFNNTYKHLRGRLFRTENKTTVNAKGLGLVKGVSDLQFILHNGKICPIELKLNGTRHKTKHIEAQFNWIEGIKKLSGIAFFCYSFEHFKEIIDKLVHFNQNQISLEFESEKSISYIQKVLSEAYLKGSDSVLINFK